MSDKIKKPYIHENHAKPVTRRDFLAQGFISMSALALAPTALGYLFRESQAWADTQGCSDAKGPAAGLIPFLVFDMAGGAGLPGNFLVGNKGGPKDLLASYDTLGWDPREANSLDESFGVPMSAKYSKVLQGIKQFASPQAQTALRMGTMCNFSRDDTSVNPLSILTLVNKAGYTGAYVPTGLGNKSSFSGGNSEPVLKELTLKPMFVKSVNDVLDSFSYGPAFKGMSPAAIRAMAQATKEMSAEQAKKLVGLPMGDQLAALAGCGYDRNLSYTDGVQGVDPRGEAVFQQLYGINANSQASSDPVVFATIVMNVLKGNTGPGAITIGGYDYHNQATTATDAKDLEMGQTIGRALEAAYRMGKPLFFQIVTDGGVYAKVGTRQWQGDSPVRSLTVVGWMNPAMPPKMKQTQIGNYSNGQGVDQTTLVGAEPSKTAYACFANYLKACGKVEDFEKYVPRGIFTPKQLESLLLFE